MARTINETIRICTEEYLKIIDVDNPPTPADIEAELVTFVKEACMLENQVRAKVDSLKAPTKLLPAQIAEVMLKLYHIVKVTTTGNNTNPEYDLLAIYQSSGEDKGIYITDESIFKKLATAFNYTITGYELNEVIEILSFKANRVCRTQNQDLIAVNNGVFNYKSKQLEPFSPKYVFLSKSKVDYNPNATNVIIHNDVDGTDWDVESWMADLSDDPEVVELLWEILSALVRPFVRWNKSAWFYSNTGNNGKGTLCELMRRLCGDGSYATIPLTDFSKDFALEPLTRSTAIIVDENDVGCYIDKAANLKAVITNDVISVNRKFKTPISYQFYGFMVQCLNEFPRIKDKSESFYRRQLFIPFNKCFTGRERKYIKNDYLHRPEVLEYVLYKVLMTNFYSLSEPAACKCALDEYKEYNDPVRQFLDEILPQLKWNLVPFSFLYDLYKAWFRNNSPSGIVEGRNTFINEVIRLLSDYDDWHCIGKGKEIRRGSLMDDSEPLILEYDLVDWKNPNYIGNDASKITTPGDALKPKYRGIIRSK
ncbi:MAG: hypothetical protein E7507_04400 [Ruminococcus sp.]|nr:hypothetical protein [Ruminococcus sp.]